jgi:hypothetical protein
MQTVIIYGTKLEYKRTHRALRLFEAQFGKPAEKATETYTDVTNLMWCIVKVQAEKAKVEFKMTVEEFVDYLDDNPEALQGFSGEKADKASEETDEQGQKKSD